MDPSLEVQVTAYDLLHHAAKPYTENIVLEAEVDTGAEVKPFLPAELTQLVTDHSTDVEEVIVSLFYLLRNSLSKKSAQESLPHLLAWMIIFDLFTDAVSAIFCPKSTASSLNIPFAQSAKVKNGYLDHLRTLRLVENHLLPTVFGLLHIGVAGKPLPLDAWE